MFDKEERRMENGSELPYFASISTSASTLTSTSTPTPKIGIMKSAKQINFNNCR